jgi:tRNA 2-thiouridine synthesizing protein B
MLHTVNKSPFDRNSLEVCLKHAKKGAAILLIEDGIYGALKGTAVSKKVGEALKKVSIYALYPDIEARGMQDRAMDGIKLIDYSGFVDLVAEHNTVQAWL